MKNTIQPDKKKHQWRWYFAFEYAPAWYHSYKTTYVIVTFYHTSITRTIPTWSVTNFIARKKGWHIMRGPIIHILSFGWPCRFGLFHPQSTILEFCFVWLSPWRCHYVHTQKTTQRLGDALQCSKRCLWTTQGSKRWRLDQGSKRLVISQLSCRC